MKKQFLIVSLLACVSLGAEEFTPGGVSVDFDSKIWQSAVPSKSGKNYVLNGSFEEPGTNPNGHRQIQQKHWCGFANIGNTKNPVSKEYRKEISSKVRRSVVEDKNAPSGKKVLAVVTLPSVKKAELPPPFIQHKVMQDVTIPTVPAGGVKYVVALKAKGSPGTKLSFQLNTMKKQPGAKPLRTAKGQWATHPLTPEWRPIVQELVVPQGSDLIDLTLVFEGIGEFYVDDVTLVQKSSEDPLQVTTIPAEQTDGITHFAAKSANMMTFVFDHDGSANGKDLFFTVELPPDFYLSDYRRMGKAGMTRQGNKYTFSLAGYVRPKHLQDWYQYQAFSLLLGTACENSDRLHKLRFYVHGKNWRGKSHEVSIKVDPPVSGRRPKLFKTSAMFGHEIEFSEKGCAEYADFYARSGFNCVDGAVHSPVFAKIMKKMGFPRYCEAYYLANGYTLGALPKPEDVKFRRADGRAVGHGICPVEVYKEGPYFKKAVQGLIEEMICKKDLTDSIMPNWEPNEYDSQGCFCPRCLEEFILYCKGKLPEKEIRALWPGKIFSKHFDIWQKFRSHQHGLLLKTLEKVTAAAGKKVGRESHFIPEITQANMLLSCLDTNKQIRVEEYWDLPYLEPWGPYIVKDLTKRTEYFPAPHLLTYRTAGEIKRFLRERIPANQKPPRLIALPHSWQWNFWLTEPECLTMDMLSFFVWRWDGAFLYYFPRGYDSRWWRCTALANSLIAEYEEIVLKGKIVTDKVEILPVTGLPRTYYAAKFQEIPGVPSRLPGLSKASPVQYRAFSDGKKTVVAVANFWLKGEHFFKLRLRGLKGNFEVQTGTVSRGIFSGEDLDKGILMQTGALRWRFITVERRDKISLPLFSCERMEKLLNERKPFIDKALKKEAELFAARFKDPDLSDVAPVSSGVFSAKVEDGRIAVTLPGAKYLVDVLKGGGIVGPEGELAVPAFWWTTGGPASLKKIFTVKRLAAATAGIVLELERTIDSSDKAELAQIKVNLSYLFHKEGFRVAAILVNGSDDPVPFAFRFYNHFAGKEFLADGRSFHRNYAVSLFRNAKQPDEFLDNVGKPGRIEKIKGSAISSGDWKIVCKPEVYGFFAWDNADLKYATLEPVWNRIMLGPGLSVTYVMEMTKTGK